ncbi:MAG: hypothetical protein Q9170_002999 [Blastenia crenularia]
MPSSSRKRGAPVESDVPSPAKRTRVVQRDQGAKGSKDSHVKIDPKPKAELKSSPTIKDSRKIAASLSTEAPEGEPANIVTTKRVAKTKTVKAVISEVDSAAASSPKESRKRVLTELVKEEEEEEEQRVVDQETPKKARKRKAAKEEAKIEVVNGEEATPKKPKRKRKTQEEKDAEAMPLAARTTGLKMFFGAHVSGAKGAFLKPGHGSGNAFALFLKSQRKWENPPLQDEHRDAFRANCIELKYDAMRHVVPHGSYLVNLAQEDPDKAKQAYDSFVEDLHRCEALGIKLYNFHPGTTNNSPRPAAIARIASSLNRALSTTHTITPLLETMAGSGTVIGSTFTDLSSIISLISPQHKSRIGITLDTCHLFAAGYDLRSPSSFASVLADLDKTVGLKYVKALHLNDSKAPLGSRRDLHANIGTGFLGLRAFWNVVNEKAFEGLPMVLETPIERKVDGEGKGKEDDDNREEDGDAKGEVKAKGKKREPIKPPKEKTIEDKSIWAREIKLLESLIGMDPDGEEFLRLEKELADQGAEERKKYQEAFDRKVAKEEKVKTKSIDSFFVKGKGKAKAKGKKDDDAVVDGGSPLSELSELSDSSGK